jgi:hypothetical protein
MEKTFVFLSRWPAAAKKSPCSLARQNMHRILGVPQVLKS